MLVGTGAHMTAVELRAWTRFNDSARLLEELLSRHLSREHGMSHSEYEVLVRLDGADGRMRMSTLAEQVVWSASRLTHTIDRLEGRGWVVRDAVADDRRGFWARLTAAGSTALAEAAPKHADLIKHYLLARFDVEELVAFGDTMDRISTSLRADRTS